MHTSAEDAPLAAKSELDRLMAAFFRAVSFEPGGAPPYDELYGLFIKGGLLIKNTSGTPEVAGVSQFIELRLRLVQSGRLTAFREVELAESTDVFGNIAHRLSAYAKTGTTDGAPIAGRGVISTQFVRTPDGWKISAMAWDDERDGLSIPERYLG